MQVYQEISVFWGKREEVDEKPPELVCPICMDILVGGVSTKCGHTFCWQCLDEAVLLKPGMPKSIQVVPFVGHRSEAVISH